MKTRSIVLLCCVTMAAIFAYTQTADDGYQVAKVVSFERMAASTQHMEKSDDYKISMRLGDTVYNCKASASVEVFNDWTTGKQFPARLDGKVLLVKNPDGQVIELKIVGKKTK